MTQLPEVGEAPRSHRRRTRQHRDHDSAAAANERRGAAGLAASFVAVCVGAPLSFVLLAVAQRVLPGRPVGEAAAFLPLWLSGVAAAMWVSRRHRSGRLAADVGLRVQAFDLLGGIVVAFAIVQVHELVVTLVAAASPSLLGPQSGFVTPPDWQPAPLLMLTVVLTAIVGPIAEEIFFRGVVQTSLATRYRPAVAVAGQAVIAGLCHANPGLGAHTTSVVLAATAAAIVLGITRELTGRLGAGIAGRVIYELLVVLAVLRGA